MAKSSLTAQTRKDSKNPRELRRSGKVPATLYGKGMESLSLELDAKEFFNTYKKDKNAIFSLNIDKENFDSVVKKVQMKSMKNDILNVEFQQIRSDAKLKMVIPVEIIGESPAVKAGGTLTANLTKIEVECLPADIPSLIQIDISGFENFEDSITVGEVSYPEGVQPTLNAESVVIKVSAPAAAEEEFAAAEEGVEEAEAGKPEEASAE